MNPIRVVLVDDHPMVRRGLRSLLSEYPDIQVVGDFEKGADALESAAELQPDVLLIDIKMQGMDGISLANQLRQTRPEAKIIHLTAYEDDEYLQSAFRAGASAYLLKSAADETVVDAVRRVHSGERLLSPSLMSQVLRQYQNLAQSDAQHQAGLDDQDLQVLVLAAQGATNDDIAKSTSWSERTVKRRIEEICDKLSTRNRTQAVAKAIKMGLI